MLICLSRADIATKLHDQFQYALPVIYLLLERALWVLNEAHSVVLHPHELNVIRDSLDTLWEPITVRSAKLRCECINHSRTGGLRSCLFTQPSSICRTAILRRR